MFWPACNAWTVGQQTGEGDVLVLANSNVLKISFLLTNGSRIDCSHYYISIFKIIISNLLNIHEYLE